MENNKLNINTLIIPDIHGRTFWKDALNNFSKKSNPNLDIVFLGDYLDPYGFEGITKENAIENFKEIIEVAKNDDRIHLLFGNHDMHYWYNAEYKCRIDSKNYNKIKDLFLQNFTLFNVAYENYINGIRYLYTHAGVSLFWLRHLQFVGKLSVQNNKEWQIDRLGNKVKKLSDEQLPFAQMLETMTPDAEKLNKMKLNFQGQANLWMASWARGGDYQNGSCIWADVSEHITDPGVDDDNLFQVFGHSLAYPSFDEPYIDLDKKIAMLDCRSAWAIDDNNNFIQYKN